MMMMMIGVQCFSKKKHASERVKEVGKRGLSFFFCL